MLNYTIRNCQFAFRCTKQWPELARTDNDKKRFCDDCQQNVFLCESDAELTQAVIQNRCIAIPARSFGEDFEVGFPA